MIYRSCHSWRSTGKQWASAETLSLAVREVPPPGRIFRWLPTLPRCNLLIIPPFLFVFMHAHLLWNLLWACLELRRLCSLREISEDFFLFMILIMISVLVQVYPRWIFRLPLCLEHFSYPDLILNSQLLIVFWICYFSLSFLIYLNSNRFFFGKVICS